MKKIVIAILLLCLQSVASAEYWKVKDLYYKFNFMEGKMPSYTVLNGDWHVGSVESREALVFDFENQRDGFLPVSGVWELSNGVYKQTAEGASATTRSLLKDNYDDFALRFEVTPLSEYNTLMIYFGYEGEGKYHSIEINAYESKLILNGEEYAGKGSILKDQKYDIKLVLNHGVLSLYCNSALIFTKSGLPELKGQVGIGSWNSKMEFDNLHMVSVPPLGIENKLIGNAKNEAIAVFPNLIADNFMITMPLAAKGIYSGEVGVFFRGTENGDGYIAAINKNSVYIARSAERKQILKKALFKPQSMTYYRMTVLCDGKKITVLVDGQELLSVEDSSFTDGLCGIYAKSVEVYCENVEMSLLEEVTPPVISEGDTTYYIDSERGNDRNDGKTPETAWKSLDKPMQCTFAPGDRLLLKRDGHFEGTLTFKDIQGTPDRPFVLSSYGEGELPTLTASGKGIVIEDCANITISDIDLTLRHFGTPNNIWVGEGQGITVKNARNIILENCRLRSLGADTHTFAVNLDSEKTLNEITEKSVSYQGFGVDGLCVNGILTAKDVSTEVWKDHWAYSHMKALVQANILNEYRPDDVVTRAEFSTMLISLLSLERADYRGIFKDIASDAWYASNMQTVSDYRILPTEMTAGSLAKPAEPILREEAAVMTLLALGNTCTAEYEYRDLDEAEPWTVKYIQQISADGIMQGGGDGSFQPKGAVTRGEAAVILLKMNQLIKGEAS